mmetsp:Transcript_9762/g.29681  ORF Transcript_9762/g.29681 Transcript_9762/m.29681 type:complete len:338 (+) Transcript_9762:96-1109(+)
MCRWNALFLAGCTVLLVCGLFGETDGRTIGSRLRQRGQAKSIKSFIKNTKYNRKPGLSAKVGPQVMAGDRKDVASHTVVKPSVHSDRNRIHARIQPRLIRATKTGAKKDAKSKATKDVTDPSQPSVSALNAAGTRPMRRRCSEWAAHTATLLQAGLPVACVGYAVSQPIPKRLTTREYLVVFQVGVALYIVSCFLVLPVLGPFCLDQLHNSGFGIHAILTQVVIIVLFLAVICAGVFGLATGVQKKQMGVQTALYTFLSWDYRRRIFYGSELNTSTFQYILAHVLYLICAVGGVVSTLRLSSETKEREKLVSTLREVFSAAGVTFVDKASGVLAKVL